MFAGHAALALALKARAPRVPFTPLILACFGPDWLEVALMLPHPREGMGVYSHSVQAVLVGASAAAGAYALLARRPGAMQVLLGWLLHWPLDFVTGRKPLTSVTELVGLDLYHRPFTDFFVEALLLVVACALYARRFAPTGVQRRLVVAMGGMLLVLQLGVDVAIAEIDGQPWKPMLAPGR